MRIAALFAGIGGLECGLREAGHKTLLTCEIWGPAVTVLAARIPQNAQPSQRSRFESAPGKCRCPHCRLSVPRSVTSRNDSRYLRQALRPRWPCLGVLLGHRRKLLRAIANIEATTQTASSAVGGTVAVDVSPRDTAERRQVTVMFSDLVGSTALSARMDPEDDRPLPLETLRAVMPFK